jgi:hypothetical protein
MPTARERWFAEVLRAGLDTRVLNEHDILTHATPAVLTASLPRDVMVKVIEATLASGTMSHKAIVEVVSIDLLAEKVPPNVTWACIAQTAERGGIRDGIPKDEGPAREWLRRSLEAGLKTGVLTPKDVVQHVNAQVLGTSLPEALTTKLLEATLTAGKMNPEIIVETLGVDNIAKHISTKVVWSVFVKPGEAPATANAPAAIANAAAAPIGMPALTPPGADKKPAAANIGAAVAAAAEKRPALEFVDDDVGNILVELEEAAFEAEAKRSVPEDKPKAAAKQPRPS